MGGLGGAGGLPEAGAVRGAKGSLSRPGARPQGFPAAPPGPGLRGYDGE